MNIASQKLELATRVIRKAFKDYKGKFGLIIFLGFLAGLSGGIGVGAIIPLFSIYTGQSMGVADIITQFIQKIFAFLHLPFTLLFLVAFIGGLFVFKAIIQFSVKYVNGKAIADYEEKLRSDLFSKTMNASWSFLLNQKTGYLERILMNDVISSAKMMMVLANLILLGTSLISYAFVAFNISALVSLLTMFIGGLLFFVFKPLYYKSRKIAREVVSMEKTTAHFLSESVQNSKAIKISGMEKRVIEKIKVYFQNLRKGRTLAAFYNSAVGPAFEPIGLIFIVVLFMFYRHSPGFSIISFAATIYLVQKMFSFIELSQGNIQQISEMTPYLQSILDYRSLASENREIASGVSGFIFNKEIKFENICFSYEKREEVLSNLNFWVKRGEMVGLIGSSGAGKTTIADLLLRLFQPSSGKILLDGIDIEEVDIKKWRNKIGYFSQDVFMLNDTIENNIRFFDESISKNDVLEAIKTANAIDFVYNLPEGLDTVIGERGVKLSMGQRQRIALARVLAKKPEILILDEATSALDNESELLVQKAIEDLKGKVTVLAIAHRLSTVINSDRLLVLEKGKILEEGAPQELLKNQDSHFYKIYNIRGE
jgi:ABC-type multidrug transport system fused ATPase/permease subunit